MLAAVMMLENVSPKKGTDHQKLMVIGQGSKYLNFLLVCRQTEYLVKLGNVRPFFLGNRFTMFYFIKPEYT